MYERIKMTTGKIKPHISPQLEIQVGETSKIIKDPDEIANHFRDHNIKHFSQAHGCKFTTPEFQGIISKDQFNAAQINPGSSEWKLQEMINEVSVETDELEINPEEWKNKFQHWKESTSTSPSGVHLGHHKVLIEPIFVTDGSRYGDS